MHHRRLARGASELSEINLHAARELLHKNMQPRGSHVCSAAELAEPLERSAPAQGEVRERGQQVTSDARECFVVRAREPTSCESVDYATSSCTRKKQPGPCL
jgi:hypothetical protein